MTWMLQVGQNKGTECNEMRNFSLNAIVVTTGRVTIVKRNKEQTALKDYGNHLPHPTARCFFLWYPLEFNLFNQYQKYRNRIGSLLTSIGIDIAAKIQYRPNLKWLTSLTHAGVELIIRAVLGCEESVSYSPSSTADSIELLSIPVTVNTTKIILQHAW